MIPNSPVSPLFKSGHFALEWFSDNHDSDVFEADTVSYFPRSESDCSSLNQTTALHVVRETHNRLQVVPDLNSNPVEATSEENSENITTHNSEFIFYVTSPKEKVSLSDCMFSEKLKTTNSNVKTLSLPETTTRKLSDSEIELLKLLSPSLVGKSPKFSFGSSRESRRSSEDLSVYLPENFTPAPVEKLVSSLEDTIFKFPEVSKKEDETQNCEQITPSNELQDLGEDMVTETSFFEENENVTECQKRKVSSDKRSASPTFRKRRKNVQNQKERIRKTYSYLDDSELRNKMERDRRSELNSKFNSLRDTIPELNGNAKASKISILERAANYCVELRETDDMLLQEKLTLKKENEALWNRLLQLSSDHQ